jgi:hypothetical protein
MKTGGTKTLYSWRDGGIVSTTEGAKTTADNLKNPLGADAFLTHTLAQALRAAFLARLISS